MNIAEEYLETRVMTASPEELHLMVIDGAIRNAMHAREALTEKNYEGAHNALSQARQFVVELICGLNDEQSEEVVTNLKRLFAFAYQRLNEADMFHDVDMIQDALQVLESHRETWKEVIRRTKLGIEPS